MLRGFCIILVVIYHAMYNLTAIFSVDVRLFGTVVMDSFRICFVVCLVLISGISCSLTRSNAKRGIKTLAAGLLVTAVTYFAIPDQLIIFGILHFFGVAMLLYAAIGRFLEKIPMLIGAAVSVVLFVISFQVFSVEIYTNSEILNLLLGMIGFNTGIISADYYPLFPWIFIFLAGSFLGRPFKKGTAPKLFRANPVKALSFVGRHTLLVYLIHQPIIYGGMYLWFEYFA